MKRILTFTMLLSALFFASSCEEEKQEYVAPVFDELTVTPNPCEPGEKLTIVAKPSKLGENWYFYRFLFRIGDNTVFSYQKDNETATWQSKEAKCECSAPTKPGNYTVTFSGSLSAIAGSKLYDDLGTCTVTLKVNGEVEEEGEEEEE